MTNQHKSSRYLPVAERVLVVLAGQEQTEESIEEDDISVSQETQKNVASLNH